MSGFEFYLEGNKRWLRRKREFESRKREIRSYQDLKIVLQTENGYRRPRGDIVPEWGDFVPYVFDGSRPETFETSRKRGGTKSPHLFKVTPV